MLPPDDHVHSEWSWDTLTGNMERTCARAVEIGLPSVAFTEHVDFAPYVFDETHMPYMPEAFLRHMGGGMVLRHPDIDVDGYLASIERCRERFPTLRILSGAEISEPHWHPEKVGKLLRGDRFQRILASVHSRPVAGGAELVDFAYGSQPPRDIVTEYLQEVLRMIEGSSAFQILAHIDYPFRGWLAREETFNPTDFEDQLRTVLRALKRVRPRPRSEHAHPFASQDRALVVRDRRRRRQLRERRPPARARRVRLRGGRRHRRSARLPARQATTRLLAACTDAVRLTGERPPSSDGEGLSNQTATRRWQIGLPSGLKSGPCAGPAGRAGHRPGCSGSGSSARQQRRAQAAASCSSP